MYYYSEGNSVNDSGQDDNDLFVNDEEIVLYNPLTKEKQKPQNLSQY